jgi:hypothetical protein
LGIRLPTVRSHNCSRGYVSRNKWNQFLFGAIFDNAQAQPSGVEYAFNGHAVFVGLVVFRRLSFPIFPAPNFNGADYYSLFVITPAFASGATPDKAFVHFNRIFPPYRVPVWPNHTRSQFVEDLEGCFVTGQAELSLKL